jgi:hypothetical protein
MHPIRVFVTPLSAALVGTVLMAAPAPCATDPDPTAPAETAGRLDDRADNRPDEQMDIRLDQAHRAVTNLEARLAGREGAPLPAPLATDLWDAARTVGEAEALAGGGQPLGTALARVRVELTEAGRAARWTPHAAVLLDDAALTLAALSISSAPLRALGQLAAGAPEALGPLPQAGTGAV